MSSTSLVDVSLRQQWNTLYRTTLPILARFKDPTQRHWPVYLDHCFARIILDNVVGIDTPWTQKLKSPAIHSMNEEQLRGCIELGNAIAEGTVDLDELDERSLALRQKVLKRRRPEDELLKGRTGGAKRQQLDIKTAMTGLLKLSQIDMLPKYETRKPARPLGTGSSPSPLSPTLITKINNAPSLTPYRRRVLLALLQVPRGHYTTYAALSSFLHSSPRAVGNAMRNNPFAPEVPCHRVVAADGGLGGFGGEWGKGEKREEKVKLLRAEGVIVDVGKGKVEGKVWSGFGENVWTTENSARQLQDV